MEIKYFWFVMWPCGCCITWLCWWGTFVQSHHPAKFGIHWPCESGDKIFLICHMTTQLKCHMTLWVGSPCSKSPPCKVWCLQYQFQFQFQSQCRGSNAVVYKWPILFNVFYWCCSSIKEINRLISKGMCVLYLMLLMGFLLSKGMSNIYYWKKLTF